MGMTHTMLKGSESSWFTLLLLLAMACVGATAFTGCSEEVGCTDRRGENYNPDAVRDDGNCINARDKFLGVYRIINICWPDTLKLLPRLMTIAEDDLRVEEQDDIKLLNFGFDSITVRGLISKNQIRIPRQDLSVGGIPFTFRGEGHIDDDGYVTILYSMWLPNSTIFKENCVVFATPVL